MAENRSCPQKRGVLWMKLAENRSYPQKWGVLWMKLGGNEVLSAKDEDKVVGKGEIGMEARCERLPFCQIFAVGKLFELNSFKYVFNGLLEEDFGEISGLF